MERTEVWFVRAFLLVTAVLVVAAFCGAQPDKATTLVILVVGVVMLGLPHGALDPMVARKAFANHGRYSSVVFYAVYLLAVLMYAAYWMRLPTMGLGCFLILSAYHFGSDWYRRGTVLTRLGYGLTVVTLPALLHASTVAEIFTQLGTQHAQTLVSVSRVVAPLALVAGGAGAILQFRQRRTDLAEFLAVVAGALLLEPLVFFTCYFSLLHSPRHLLETAQELGLTNFRKIAFKSLPILVATLALAALFYLHLQGAQSSGRIVMTVFIGLAALTVPHMLLDTLASERRKTKLLGESKQPV
jgi:Brp/Blh family beta-carotene 15,15'-monooxygenase